MWHETGVRNVIFCLLNSNCVWIKIYSASSRQVYVISTYSRLQTIITRVLDLVKELFILVLYAYS